MSHQARHDTNNFPELPINLRERFGKEYSIGFEDWYHANKKKNCTKAEAVALQIIRCKYGHIFPWGPDRLAASTDRKGKIANQLTALDCCKVEQAGNDGVNVSFALADFDTVADVMQPIRQRKLTPERRKAFIETGRDHQFTKSTGQTKVFRGQNAYQDTNATSEPSKRSDAKIATQKKH